MTTVLHEDQARRIATFVVRAKERILANGPESLLVLDPRRVIQCDVMTNGS